MSNHSKKTHEPFFIMTIEQIKNDYALNLITTEAYILYIVKALRRKGWKMSVNVREFCEQWNIKERTFYRAIKNLKERGSLNLESNQKVMEVYWGDNSVSPVDSSSDKYIEFLQSDYWRNVRTIVLDRDNGQCTNCESTKALQVHHLTYKHHQDELNHLGDLTTLCKSCHEKAHDIK